MSSRAREVAASQSFSVSGGMVVSEQTTSRSGGVVTIAIKGYICGDIGGPSSFRGGEPATVPVCERSSAGRVRLLYCAFRGPGCCRSSTLGVTCACGI
jgi:hypothetical protein